MYTCKQCSHSEIHLGFWICRAKEDGRLYPHTALGLERKEKCPDFHTKNPVITS